MASRADRITTPPGVIAVVAEELGAFFTHTKKVLGGLASIADGVAVLRTHAGSAHGKGRRPFPLRPRHARLAVHAAHTLVVYLIERAEDVKK